MRRGLIALSLAALVAAFTASGALAARQAHFAPASPGQVPKCQQDAWFCTEVSHSIGAEGSYTGHDEPAMLFYSKRPGSGNNQFYRFQLPHAPGLTPTQHGGGTYDFQLHPAFWLGMALCDSQSDPNYTHTCKRDTDANIYNSSDPSSPRYIGKHPGTAFLELQFYPPGWAPFSEGGISCDARSWCSAMVIWSLSDKANTGELNNGACLNQVGEESPNFAFITHNGHSQAPANAVSFYSNPDAFTPDPSKDLFMKPGDNLTIRIRDTSRGLLVVIHDLTNGQSGSMKASKANGFGQIKFDPNGNGCTVLPYAYHPMYSTSSPQTRIPWAAHSYNVSYSDEIGHFEACDFVDEGYCFAGGVNDPDGVDSDDAFCFGPSDSLRFAIGGCTATDIDFDGPSYRRKWPGSFTDPAQDRLYHPRPIMFTSPVFKNSDSATFENYSNLAFEADLPRIENFTTPPCQRHVHNPSDPHPGQGCVNPPAGSTFYPIFTTTRVEGSCMWQEGGPYIPGTTNTFGGSSATEFGTRASGNLLPLFYPAPGNQVQIIYEDFRHILSSNPCQAPLR